MTDGAPFDYVAASEHEELVGRVWRLAHPILSDRERIVIAARWVVSPPMTLHAVGARLGGLSRETVRNTELKALAKMRWVLRDRFRSQSRCRMDGGLWLEDDYLVSFDRWLERCA